MLVGIAVSLVAVYFRTHWTQAVSEDLSVNSAEDAGMAIFFHVSYCAAGRLRRFGAKEEECR